MTRPARIGFNFAYVGFAVIVFFVAYALVKMAGNDYLVEYRDRDPGTAHSIASIQKSLGASEPCPAPEQGLACVQWTDGKTYQVQMVYVP